jgi:hypothetical protein
MATAETPGTARRHDEAQAAKKIMRITFRKQTLDLAIGNLPFRIKNRVRKQCDGIPLSSYWNGEASIDGDSFMVLWWVARLMNGENALTLQAVIEEFEDLGDELTPDDLDIEMIDPDDPSRTDDELDEFGGLDDNPES